jgi:hypothetical protein
MGTRYAVATGNWDNPDVWSETSGGPSGALPPGPEDDAIFNAASGAITVTVTNTGSQGGIGRNTLLMCNNLTCTGFTGTIAGTVEIQIYGNVLLVAGMTFTHTGGFGFRNQSYSSTQTITSAGKTVGPIGVITVESTVELADNLTCGAITIITGAFSTSSSNYSLTCTGIAAAATNSYAPISLNFNASSVTINGNLTIASTFNTTANLSSSTITFTNATSTLTAVNRTFGTVIFNNAGAAGTCAIASAGNTFTNLTINGPSSGIRFFSLAADITVTGTLTVSGNGGGSQLQVISNTLGTQRTITAAAYAGSATDVVWRDIIVAGAAAPISGTRFGDMGNNSGITMSAPKTVYWNLAGSQTWTANAWATTSGGSPGIDNYPLPQDTGVFDDAGSITTLTLSDDVMGTVDMSARTSAMTVTASTSLVIYGGWAFGSGVTSTSNANTITFRPVGAKTITSNSKTFGSPVTIDTGASTRTGTIQLGDALLLESGKTLTITAGTFDANNYSVTAGSMVSSGTLTRFIKMGSGTWTLMFPTTTINANAWNISDSTNCSLDPGTSEILLASTGTGQRSFYGGSLSYNKVTVGPAAGTAQTIFWDFNVFNELASIKTAAFSVFFHTGGSHYIKTWSLTGSAGNVATLNRTFTSQWSLVLFNRSSGIDYLNVSNCTVSTASAAEFYVGANSTNTTGNTRVVFTAAPAARTLYWVGGTGNWSSSTKWSLSSGGASGEAQPTSADDVIFDAASNATAYTATIDSNLGARCKTLTMGGPTSGNITWAGSQPMYIHDDISLSGGANITRTYTGVIHLCGAGSGLSVDSNGVTLASTINIYSPTAEWVLGSALNIGAGVLTVIYGSIDLDTYNLTAAAISSDYATKRSIDLGSGTATLSSTTPIIFGTTTRALDTLVLTKGTSTLTCSSATALTFAGNGNTFHNVSFTGTSAATHTITGANTFNNLTFTAPASDGLTGISFGANQTISGTLTASGATVLRRLALISNTLGTARTLSVATYAASAQDTDFRDIVVTGGAAPLTGTRLGDWGGNTGITTATPKTVYWNLSGTQNWTATGWATSSGGSPAADNFPLAQDTAIFDDAGSAGTITVTSTYALPSIDASARTSAMTLTASAGMSSYGGMLLGSGVSTSWSNQDLTFLGRGSYNLNSAGKNMPYITMQGFGGTMTLQAAFSTGDTTASGYLRLFAGKFDLNDYTFTTARFISTTGGVSRTLDFGTTGVLNLGRTSSASQVDMLIDMVAGGTNFNVEGNSDIRLTANTASARWIQPDSPFLNVNITAGSGQIRFGAATQSWNVKNLSFAGSSTGSYILGNSACNVYGDFTMVAGMTVALPSSVQAVVFIGDSILTTAGVQLRRTQIAGKLRLADNVDMVAGTSLEFSGGVLDLNGYDWTVPAVYTLVFGNSNDVRVVKSNGGEIILTNNNTTILNIALSYYVVIYNDPAVIISNYSGGTGTRTFSFTSPASWLTSEYVPNTTLKITNGTDTVSLVNGWTSVDFTGFSGTLANTANIRPLGNITLSVGMSITAGNVFEPVVAGGRPALFDSVGRTIENPIRVYAGLPGGIKFASATTLGSARELRYDFGLVDCNNYSVSVGTILTSASNPRMINTGSAGISLLGSSTTVFSANTPTFHFTKGAGGINATYSGGTGTRTFDVGSTSTVPSAANSKYIPPLNFTAGTDIVAIAGGSRVYGDINFTGFSGTHTVQANNIWYGSATFSGTMTLTASASAQSFNGNVTQNIRTNGLTIDWPVTINKSGGAFTLLDNTTIGSGRTITFTAGGIDLNNNTLSVGLFSSSNSNVRQITFGSGTLTLVGAGTAWTAATSTNFTINAGTGTISMTSGSAKTFSGGGLSYPKLNQGGAGSLSILGTNTFADIGNTNPTACTIIFPNVTTTVANFTASGTSGNLLTLARTGASGTFTLSKTSGVVGVDFISVSNSIATGGATWYAGANSTNGGNNTGWIFSAAPSTSTGNMFFMFA